MARIGSEYMLAVAVCSVQPFFLWNDGSTCRFAILQFALTSKAVSSKPSSLSLIPWNECVFVFGEAGQSFCDATKLN